MRLVWCKKEEINMPSKDTTTLLQIIAIVVGFIIFGPIVLSIFAGLFYLALFVLVIVAICWLLGVFD